MPGLTGLRGIAVAAVVAYHLGYLPGGFVGVDLFFALSGFLITGLLLSAPPTGVAGMLSWWGRRIRRLTPAVAVVVLAVLVVFLTRSGIALDALATMTWWQNWRLIAEGTPYWAGSPSPLRHAWSLSIEEQFYVLWPPVLLAALAIARRLGRSVLVVAAVALGGALASFVWAATLASASVPDLSRIYFGTDTRAGALLVGCAAAALWRVRPRIARWPARPVVAIPAGAVLVVLSIVMEPDQRWAYRGGLAVAAVAALTLVLGCTTPGPVATALSATPLQWIGTRSYAIYLWSWPIQVACQDRFPELPLIAVAAITVGASVPLASISLRLVEEPLRRGSSWAARPALRRAAWSIGLIAVAATTLLAANSTELTPVEEVAQEFERQPDPTTTTTTEPPPGETTTTCPPRTTAPPPTFSGGTSAYDPSTVAEAGDPTPDVCGGVTRLLVVGDSTGRGAANGLRRTAPEGLEVWDRTQLGCGLRVPTGDCGDWRQHWTDSIAQVDPDVVLVHLGVSDDVVDGPDAPFLSDEARAQRQQVIAEAIGILGSRGARVAWILPAVPIGPGIFYCGNKARNSECDPAWVARWSEDVTAVAASTGAQVVDVGGWVNARGATLEDRPDGLHLSGPALDAEAEWLAGQLR